MTFALIGKQDIQWCGDSIRLIPASSIRVFFFHVCTYPDREKVIHPRAILRGLSLSLFLPPRNASSYLGIGSGVSVQPPDIFPLKD